MKPIRYGMIGGGQGAFIGGVHRTAAAIAGNWRLVGGGILLDGGEVEGFGRRDRRRSGAGLWLVGGNARARGGAARRASGSRRYRSSRPTTCTLPPPSPRWKRASMSSSTSRWRIRWPMPRPSPMPRARTGRRIAVTHTYTGYPLVKQARRLVTSGQFGKVRRVAVKYTQDWLSPRRRSGRQQAGRLAGRSGAVRRCRGFRRYRHPCRQPRRIHHRRDGLRRSAPS